jgi:hypothetical protein
VRESACNGNPIASREFASLIPKDIR